MRSTDAGNIESALERIDPVFLDTPLLRETSLDAVLGVELVLKVESLNPIRSFKGRGTELFASYVETGTPLLCASAGNFGQGLARAGQRRGCPVTVFAAETANPLKIQAMRALGADVRLIGRDFDEAKAAARASAKTQGILFVEDGNSPEIAEGAGTMALEITRSGADVDTILVPLGNGALATGVGTWFRHAAPAVKVVGVVASAAPSMQDSFRAGRAVSSTRSDTIADGIAVREPVAYAVECMKTTVDEVVAADEETILRAMRLVLEHLGLVIEPAGVVGVAAILCDPERWRDRRIASVLCGGNVTPAQIKSWLG